MLFIIFAKTKIETVMMQSLIFIHLPRYFYFYRPRGRRRS
ncbi:hypothetical protein Cabys_1731 [Caldithrix abyssi DSM 13497]|uniref:Uncharacterized protein n=1 Tax=Caldithrix abyssi DSM 13497 TaxID=880073 RepID=A0A1J1C994_CALAY|nr:hypothetical protein Cabys_1731 [Caldithrix abyssi DSM 13497]